MAGTMKWIATRTRVGSYVSRRREGIERGFRKWTIVVGIGLVIATITVQIGEYLVVT